MPTHRGHGHPLGARGHWRCPVFLGCGHPWGARGHRCCPRFVGAGTHWAGAGIGCGLRVVGAGTHRAGAGIGCAHASWVWAPIGQVRASALPAFRGCGHPSGMCGHRRCPRFVGAGTHRAGAGIDFAHVSWVRASIGHLRASALPTFRGRGHPHPVWAFKILNPGRGGGRRPARGDGGGGGLG